MSSAARRLALFGGASPLGRAVSRAAPGFGWEALDMSALLGPGCWELAASDLEPALGGFDAALVCEECSPEESAARGLPEALGILAGSPPRRRHANFPFQLGAASRCRGIPCMLQSDACVFRSRAGEDPRSALDPKDPRGVHGLGKAAGEAALLFASSKSCVARVDFIFGRESMECAWAALREASAAAAAMGEAGALRPLPAWAAAAAIMGEFSRPGGMRAGERHLCGPRAMGAADWLAELRAACGLDADGLGLGSLMDAQERCQAGLADHGPAWERLPRWEMGSELALFGARVARC